MLVLRLRLTFSTQFFIVFYKLKVVFFGVVARSSRLFFAVSLLCLRQSIGVKQGSRHLPELIFFLRGVGDRGFD